MVRNTSCFFTYRSSTSKAKLVLLGGNDTSNVGTVTGASIIGTKKDQHKAMANYPPDILLVIRDRDIEASVVVANEIVTVADQVARAEAASEGRVSIVDLGESVYAATSRLENSLHLCQ